MQAIAGCLAFEYLKAMASAGGCNVKPKLMHAVAVVFVHLCRTVCTAASEYLKVLTC